MAEVHPGTDIIIPDAVPTSLFRSAIPNTKRYMKHNKKTLEMVCHASYEGDYDQLEELLATGDEQNLFNGDLNEHLEDVTPLMVASMSGHTDCIELLLRAKADPHMKERVKYGKDPEDGRAALDFAKEEGWDDVVALLAEAERDHPYGWYVPEGKTNNQKIYGSFQWDAKPQKGWYSSRPGVAERNGFDPNKYGTGLYRQPPEAFPVPPPPRTTPEAPRPLLKVEERQAKEEPLAPIPLALLFPGQGSQYLKMMEGCKDIPAVQTMLATAKDILGYDVLELCLNGPEEKLEETRYCQPIVFVAGMVGIEKLRRSRAEAVERFEATAGLSLGEYTALCAAGVFTFEDGLRLVRLRGEAMQKAATMSEQAMLSVAGLEKEKLSELCMQAANQEGAGAVCQVVNELFPRGYACAGTKAAILRLKLFAEEANAMQAKVLKTSGGFHTVLMEPARAQLATALDETLPRMRPAKCKIFMNTTGKPLEAGTPPEEIVTLLKMQIVSPVLWETSVRAMIASGITEFCEVGPMKQLKAMMKRIDPKAWEKTVCVEV